MFSETNASAYWSSVNTSPPTTSNSCSVKFSFNQRFAATSKAAPAANNSTVVTCIRVEPDTAILPTNRGILTMYLPLSIPLALLAAYSSKHSNTARARSR